MALVSALGFLELLLEVGVVPLHLLLGSPLEQQLDGLLDVGDGCRPAEQVLVLGLFPVLPRLLTLRPVLRDEAFGEDLREREGSFMSDVRAKLSATLLRYSRVLNGKKIAHAFSRKIKTSGRLCFSLDMASTNVSLASTKYVSARETKGKCL